MTGPAGCPSRAAPLWSGDPERVCDMLAHEGDVHHDPVYGLWRADGGWAALLASQVLPGALGIVTFAALDAFGAGLGMAALMADPDRARDECIAVPELFASTCRHRGIEAATVTGFLQAPVPLLGGDVITRGHTAAEVPAECGQVAVDWTARQFDVAAPVPLVVPLADWQAFWRPL